MDNIIQSTIDEISLLIFDKKIIRISLSEDTNELFNIEIRFRNVVNDECVSLILKDILCFDYITDTAIGYVENLKYFIQEDGTHYLSLDPDDVDMTQPLKTDNCVIIARYLETR